MTFIKLQTTGPLLVKRHQFLMLNLKKLEITNSDTSNYNIQISNKINCGSLGILNFDYCDLFGICVLLFDIFYF
jgi:hypothetical protein